MKQQQMKNRIKIGITHGDFNGISYEVILKTLSDARILELFTPVIYGSLQLFNYHRKSLGIDINHPKVITNISEVSDGSINLFPVQENGIDLQVQYGETSKAAGILAARALYDARAHLMNGDIDAVVTAPINKDAIQHESFTFKGHTEFFSEPYLNGYEPVMIFSSGTLRIALMTMHCSLAEVPHLLTKEKIMQTITRLEATLQQDFGVVKPRIAVLGLNPHAGENSLLGDEEEQIIAPAIQEAWQQGKFVFGPFPADGFWGSGSQHHYDVVLSMYHDQGLIPFKLLAMNDGVNITAGLPIIRTSPDHGTAFDIAGQGVADEGSFRNAIYAAIDIHKHRESYKEATANPLKTKYIERGHDNVRLDFSKSEDEI